VGSDAFGSEIWKASWGVLFMLCVDTDTDKVYASWRPLILFNMQTEKVLGLYYYLDQR
jgi:hypothetical protein